MLMKSLGGGREGRGWVGEGVERNIDKKVGRKQGQKTEESTLDEV